MSEQELSNFGGDSKFLYALPRTSRNLSPYERIRRDGIIRDIPTYLSFGQTAGEIAKILSLPFEVVETEVERLHRQKGINRKPETTPRRKYLTRGESENLFKKWNGRIIELRDLNWPIEQISADIGLDIYLTTEFIRRLIAQRVLEPRAKRISRPSKLPAKYRQ